MTAKENTIVEMLKRYNEAQEVGIVGSIGEKIGKGDGGDGMPKTWNQSYRELERCLKVLREDRKSQYWHLCEMFIRAETVTVTVAVKNGKPRIPPHAALELVAGAAEIGGKTTTVRARKWNPAVRAEKVKSGVKYLASIFRGEPMLPNEFLDLNERD